MKTQSTRGIAPELLVAQVRNTMPYLFEEEAAPELAEHPAGAIVREFAANPRSDLSHFEYFRLCLCAHYSTCATPVPTDVDNQIRRKLWISNIPTQVACEMAALVLESHDWNFIPLTHRQSYGAKGSEWEHTALHGHYGEWFTVAAAAYSALGQYRAREATRLRSAILQAISEETARHSHVFGSLWRAKDGLGSLLASASIAHNFGDLDRVIEMWDLPIEDPLRLGHFELTASPFDPERRLRHQGRLWTAGELYKSVIRGSSMALENHRHFALRKPRALRTRPELKIPLGPFFDDWGTRVANMLDGEDLLEVVDALAQGWVRLPKTVGYGRALHSMLNVHPSLSSRLASLYEDRHARVLLEQPREEFEREWSEGALNHLEEIPSRAS